MRVLVTGGAGYIGSIAVHELLKEGHEVIVVDNLSNGKEELVPKNVWFYNVDLVDLDELKDVFSENEIDAVIHFASYKAVDESMENAIKYSDNVTGTTNLLKCMAAFDVKKLVYSSSAAVYGVPDESVATEDTSVNPTSFYGETKLQCERMIEWFSKIYGIQYVSLRYFNVAGDYLGYIDPDAKNVLPIIIETLLGKRDKFMIFGDDYDTRDGTCVRDYVHVKDLIDAHIAALDVDTNEIINLGTAEGTTVKELVDMTEEVTGKKLNYEFAPRRVGDAGAFVASNEKAKKLLGWEPKYTVKEMIKSTYEAYKKND